MTTSSRCSRTQVRTLLDVHPHTPTHTHTHAKSSMALVALVAILLATSQALTANQAEPANPTGLTPPASAVIHGIPNILTAPVMLPGTRTWMTSSFDKSGGNADGDSRWNFQTYDARSRLLTLFEAKGNGRLIRFWMTGWKNPTTVTYEIDASAPNVREVLSLFDPARYPGFEGTVGDSSQFSGGFVSYVPVDFDYSIAIKAPKMQSPFYNQFTYRMYTDAAQRMMSDIPYLPKGQNVVLAKETPPIAPGTNQHILQADGPAIAQTITITIPESAIASPHTIQDALLQTTRIIISFDGEQQPSVDAPLSLFFGGTVQGEIIDSAAVSVWIENGYVHMANRFPMPFAQSMTITIANTGASNLPSLKTELTYTGDPETATHLEQGTLGRFTATSIDSGPLEAGTDAVLLETSGFGGKIVGVVLEAVGTDTGRYILEGDERIFLDGASNPQWHGTGMEDFFNGGWYYAQGPYTSRLSGNSSHHVDGEGDHTFQYRWLIPDAIQFGLSARISMEHGRTNDEAGRFNSTVFWYRSNKVLMHQTDVLATGMGDNSPSHNFGAEGAKPLSLEGPWLGAGNQKTALREGITCGTHSFDMSVDPHSGGAVLERVYDYSVANQSATVYIDGMQAGVWTTFGPGVRSSRMFAESSLLIPATLVEGKTSVRVTIQPSTPWTVFEYRMFSIADLSHPVGNQ